MMTTKTKETSIPEATVAAVRKAFGQHPEDVLGLAKTGEETLYWLAAIFEAIEVMDKHGHPATKLRSIPRLAEIGRYVAEDIANTLDCQREDMEENLRKAK